MMFATLPSAIGHVNGGSLKALAVTTLERALALPNVPTLSEAGVTGYEASGWYGVFVRKGTPRPIIDKLRNEVATIINLPEVRKNPSSRAPSRSATRPKSSAPSSRPSARNGRRW